jgi:molybdopterin-dependent oxidoreductase alpha subunit
MKTPQYIGGWKSIFYSLHVAKEVGLKPFTESILSKNTCKTCAYGMGGQKGGMVNEGGDTLEICKKSLQAQLTDIQPAISAEFWSENPIEDLKKTKPRELERLGRLNDPIWKSRGDSHYQVISWDEAFEKVIGRFRNTMANRTFFYSSGRSSNEAAFLLHLFARLYGTNNVNNCSYYCHQASGVGMGSMLGTGTATVQLEDVKKADLIFVIGANPASNHPRFITELLHCRRRGGDVVVINPVKEPGLVRFSIPSDWRSMLGTGSAIASKYVQPVIGGDVALLTGIAKTILERKTENTEFINTCSSGFDAYENFVKKLTWSEIERLSGISKEEIEELTGVYLRAENVIFTWAMGLTHHVHGVENVESIVNLALLRGMIGKPGAGLLPLRGHSNVQGVGSVGVMPLLKQSIFDSIEKELNVKLPTDAGWDTMECMNQAYLGNVDLAFVLGGNLYASNPNLHYAEEALNRIPFKVFLSTTLNQGHLYGVDEEVLVLPVLARDEEKQSTTQESMFNYVRLSDGGINRLTNARSESEIIAEIASEIIDPSVFDFKAFSGHESVRHVLGKIIPGFEKIEDIGSTKEEFEISGRVLHQPKFNTVDGRARFKINPLPDTSVKNGAFKLMSVRSEGQFNSIVYDEDDVWRGVSHREVILMNETDMKEKELKRGDKIKIRSSCGELTAYEAYPFDIARGCVLGYYPETNVLVASDLDPQSKTPSFKNTEVFIEKLSLL